MNKLFDDDEEEVAPPAAASSPPAGQAAKPKKKKVMVGPYVPSSSLPDALAGSDDDAMAAGQIPAKVPAFRPKPTFEPPAGTPAAIAEVPASVEPSSSSAAAVPSPATAQSGATTEPPQPTSTTTTAVAEGEKASPVPAPVPQRGLPEPKTSADRSWDDFIQPSADSQKKKQGGSPTQPESAQMSASPQQQHPAQGSPTQQQPPPDFPQQQSPHYYNPAAPMYAYGPHPPQPYPAHYHHHQQYAQQPPGAAYAQPQQQPQPMSQPTYRPPSPPPPPPELPRPSKPVPTEPPKVEPLPVPAALPQSNLAQHFQQSTNDNAAWESFQVLRKQLEDSHTRTTNLHGQISEIQLGHEKEASAFREAAQAQMEKQQKELEEVTEHYREATVKIENLSAMLQRKADYIMTCDQKLHQAAVDHAAITQAMTHTNDRARVADGARQVAEVRQRELELSLEHSSALVEQLRKQMSVAHEEKVTAMQQQYEIFEKNRAELIEYYNAREVKVVGSYNESLLQLQALMEANMNAREEKITRHWQDTVMALKDQYATLRGELEQQRGRHRAEVDEVQQKGEAEKERWVKHLREEMALLERRHTEREQQTVEDITRRERELSEREAKARVQRAQDEQDAKVALLSREAELKAYHEKSNEDLRKSHEIDRERLTTAFREQLSQLSTQHLANERELERMHRDKEREMAQRYRIAGYEVDDKKSTTDLQSVTAKTQSSLLAKFESIEAKQRERAEQTRGMFKAGDKPASPTS